MKDENKCFFSVRLANGITITDENANEVKNFLLTLYIAFTDSKKVSTNEGFKSFAKECEEYQKATLNAIHKIIKITNTKQ